WYSNTLESSIQLSLQPQLNGERCLNHASRHFSTQFSTTPSPNIVVPTKRPTITSSQVPTIPLVNLSFLLLQKAIVFHDTLHLGQPCHSAPLPNLHQCS